MVKNLMYYITYTFIELLSATLLHNGTVRTHETTNKYDKVGIPAYKNKSFCKTIQKLKESQQKKDEVNRIYIKIVRLFLDHFYITFEKNEKTLKFVCALPLKFDDKIKDLEADASNLLHKKQEWLKGNAIYKQNTSNFIIMAINGIKSMKNYFEQKTLSKRFEKLVLAAIDKKLNDGTSIDFDRYIPAGTPQLERKIVAIINFFYVLFCGKKVDTLLYNSRLRLEKQDMHCVWEVVYENKEIERVANPISDKMQSQLYEFYQIENREPLDFITIFEKETKFVADKKFLYFNNKRFRDIIFSVQKRRSKVTKIRYPCLNPHLGLESDVKQVLYTIKDQELSYLKCLQSVSKNIYNLDINISPLYKDCRFALSAEQIEMLGREIEEYFDTLIRSKIYVIAFSYDFVSEMLKEENYNVISARSELHLTNEQMSMLVNFCFYEQIKAKKQLRGTANLLSSVEDIDQSYIKTLAEPVDIKLKLDRVTEEKGFSESMSNLYNKINISKLNTILEAYNLALNEILGYLKVIVVKYKNITKEEENDISESVDTSKISQNLDKDNQRLLFTDIQYAEYTKNEESNKLNHKNSLERYNEAIDIIELLYTVKKTLISMFSD